MYKYPLNFVGITQKFKDGLHFGLDLGWSNSYGGANAPIYAAADGEVYSTNDNDKSGKSWGNFVKIKHSDIDYTLYAHLKDGLKVKKGDKVKQGDLIGYMGNTGHSFGNHLHYEVYKGGANTKYRVDPILYTYVFEDQIVHKDDEADILRYKDTEIYETKIKELEKTIEELKEELKNEKQYKYIKEIEETADYSVQVHLNKGEKLIIK